MDEGMLHLDYNRKKASITNIQEVESGIGKNSMLTKHLQKDTRNLHICKSAIPFLQCICIERSKSNMSAAYCVIPERRVLIQIN